MELIAVLAHRSVQISAVTGVALAAGTTLTPVPWWLWTAWAALTAVAVAQAVRETSDERAVA